MQLLLCSSYSNSTPSIKFWLDVPLQASASLVLERSGGAKQLTGLSHYQIRTRVTSLLCGAQVETEIAWNEAPSFGLEAILEQNRHTKLFLTVPGTYTPAPIAGSECPVGEPTHEGQVPGPRDYVLRTIRAQSSLERR
jgi:hypothetical protein